MERGGRDEDAQKEVSKDRGVRRWCAGVRCDCGPAAQDDQKSVETLYFTVFFGVEEHFTCIFTRFSGDLRQKWGKEKLENSTC